MANPSRPVLALLILLFLVISCAKQKNCYATIVCKNASGKGIDSVFVELYSYVKGTESSSATELKASGTTDETGRISFSFKEPALYTIKTAKDTLGATSIIRLQEGKEVQKDLVLN
jgi:hypothetical protein